MTEPTITEAARQQATPCYKGGQHFFLYGSRPCTWCNRTPETIREDDRRSEERAEHQMLVTAFDRLAAVLEKLEAKL